MKKNTTLAAAPPIKLEPTRALKKIARMRGKIWGIEGGQGAGKTFAILWLIIDWAWKNPGKEIIIASKELTKMRLTVIKDFTKIMRALGMFDDNLFFGDTLYIFPNGTFIKFIGLDKDDIGKGLRSDLVFLNEANKVNFETYRELTSRAKRIILDFNPNEKFWYHKEIAHRTDCQHLRLTYLDNHKISKEEKAEILSYYTKGFDEHGEVINEYWANKWRVYGLGMPGGVEGRIFLWNKCTYQDFLAVDRRCFYYSDWGKSDPWAIGAVKYLDGRMWVHELNYRSENDFMNNMSNAQKANITGRGDDGNLNEGLVTWRFNELGIPQDEYIICDSNRESKIIALREEGWDLALSCIKGKDSINAGIDILQNLEVFYTETSENIDYEQESYQWDKDRFGDTIDGKPKDKDNHHMDGIRYVADFLQREGVLNVA